ncbi:MAG: hypothetical protein ABW252_11425 [Polyangiales bacterium]
MPRRSRPIERALIALLGCGASAARADVSGALDARALIGVDHRHGGAAMVDAWGGDGWFRYGGALGIGALSGHREKSSRVLAPMAISLAIVPPGERSGFSSVLRLGGYAGGEQGGFVGGGFVGCALGYAVGLGEGASVRVSADAWGLLGPRGGFFVGPALGFGF